MTRQFGFNEQIGFSLGEVSRSARGNYNGEAYKLSANRIHNMNVNSVGCVNIRAGTLKIDEYTTDVDYTVGIDQNRFIAIGDTSIDTTQITYYDTIAGKKISGNLPATGLGASLAAGNYPSLTADESHSFILKLDNVFKVGIDGNQLKIDMLKNVQKDYGGGTFTPDWTLYNDRLQGSGKLSFTLNFLQPVTAIVKGGDVFIRDAVNVDFTSIKVYDSTTNTNFIGDVSLTNATVEIQTLSGSGSVPITFAGEYLGNDGDGWQWWTISSFTLHPTANVVLDFMGNVTKSVSSIAPIGKFPHADKITIMNQRLFIFGNNSIVFSDIGKFDTFPATNEIIVENMERAKAIDRDNRFIYFASENSIYRLTELSASQFALSFLGNLKTVRDGIFARGGIVFFVTDRGVYLGDFGNNTTSDPVSRLTLLTAHSSHFFDFKFTYCTRLLIFDQVAFLCVREDSIVVVFRWDELSKVLTGVRWKFAFNSTDVSLQNATAVKINTGQSDVNYICWLHDFRYNLDNEFCNYQVLKQFPYYNFLDGAEVTIGSKVFFAPMRRLGTNTVSLDVSKDFLRILPTKPLKLEAVKVGSEIYLNFNNQSFKCILNFTDELTKTWNITVPDSLTFTDGNIGLITGSVINISGTALDKYKNIVGMSAVVSNGEEMYVIRDLSTIDRIEGVYVAFGFLYDNYIRLNNMYDGVEASRGMLRCAVYGTSRIYTNVYYKREVAVSFNDIDDAYDSYVDIDIPNIWSNDSVNQTIELSFEKGLFGAILNTSVYNTVDELRYPQRSIT